MATNQRRSFIEMIPWSIRFAFQTTSITDSNGDATDAWKQIEYGQLRRDALWSKYGLPMHFVTLEFSDYEMERGYQADRARRHLGNGKFDLRNVVILSQGYAVSLLCSFLFSWIRYTLWYPHEGCNSRARVPHAGYYGYLATEPLVSIFVVNCFMWTTSSFLVWKRYDWYVTNYHSVQCLFALVTSLTYFSYLYVSALLFSKFAWPIEEAVSYVCLICFLGSFLGLRFVHVVYFIFVCGMILGLLRNIALGTGPFLRIAMFGNNWNQAVFVIAAITVLLVVLYFFEKLMRKDFVLSLSLAAESELSEKLLGNILPNKVIDQLKTYETSEGDGCTASIAEAFESVSMLFCEVKGLSEAMRSDCEATIMRLNRIFCRFDEITEFHGLEKIKTIGEVYMAASGLPTIMDNHAEKALLAALDMQAYVSREDSLNGLSTRIGIHSGKVVAGVIGKQKFAYDVWGDTVNTASRMQTLALDGSLQISLVTACKLLGKEAIEAERVSLLIEHVSGQVVPVELHCLGKKNVKGKGLMTTYDVRRL